MMVRSRLFVQNEHMGSAKNDLQRVGQIGGENGGIEGLGVTKQHIGATASRLLHLLHRLESYTSDTYSQIR
jgi:hypothetical protein